MKNRAKKNRVFVLGSQAWGSLLSAVYGRFSSGADVILYDMGRPYGREIANELGLGQMKKLSASDVSKIGRASGWGLYDLKGDFNSGSLFKLTIKNCVFCAYGTDIRQSCQFVRGTMEGMASAIFRVEYTAFVKCLNWDSIADHQCEVVLKAVIEKKRIVKLSE